MRLPVHLPVAVALLAMGLGACDDASSDASPLGTTVHVGYYPDSGTTRTSSIDVTVTGVHPATQAMLAAGGITADGDASDMTPYFVDVTFRNTGEVTAVDLPDVQGEAKDGASYGALVVIGDESSFADCPGVPATLAPGASQDGCSIVMVPKGGSLYRISYFPGGTEPFYYWRAA